MKDLLFWLMNNLYYSRKFMKKVKLGKPRYFWQKSLQDMGGDGHS